MANKPVLHRRDHEHGGADTVRIVYESVGTASPGAGIQFDIDNVGGTLRIETTDTLGGLPTGIGIRLITDAGDLQMNAGRNVYMDSVQDVIVVPGRDYTLSANRDVAITADRDIELRADGDNDGAGLIILANLPTSDPGVSGALWNSGGTVKIS